MSSCGFFFRGKIYEWACFHMSQLLKTETCQAFIASYIGNLTKDVIVREKFLPKVCLWYYSKIWGEMPEDFSRNFFLPCLIHFFSRSIIIRSDSSSLCQKFSCSTSTLFIDLKCSRITDRCIAFFSKMHDSWCVCMLADSFDSIRKNQTAPQFS